MLQLQTTLKQTLYWTIISILLYTGIHRFVFYAYIYSGKLLYGDRPDILLYWYFYHETYFTPMFIGVISLVAIVIVFLALRRRTNFIAVILALAITGVLEYEFNWIFTAPANMFNIFQYEFIYHLIYGIILITLAIFLIRSKKLQRLAGMRPKEYYIES